MPFQDKMFVARWIQENPLVVANWFEANVPQNVLNSLESKITPTVNEQKQVVQDFLNTYSTKLPDDVKTALENFLSS